MMSQGSLTVPRGWCSVGIRGLAARGLLLERAVENDPGSVVGNRDEAVLVYPCDYRTVS